MRKLIAALSTIVLSTTCLSSIPHVSAATSIKWVTCPEQVTAPGSQCGEIEVPMDYTQPTGEKITIGFVKRSATGSARGALFGNPGGPSGDAYTYVGNTNTFNWPESITGEWDFIGVQPRGLPGSTPIQCNVGAASSSDMVQPGAFIRNNCAQPYANNITTENTARDWEEVRKALGYKNISILGLSYGTILGSTYATLFPDHTDKLVLDSGVDPQLMWAGIMAAQEQGYINSLHEFFSYVAARDEIYHLGTTPLAVYQSWSNKVVAETGTNPTVAPPPAQIGDVPPALRQFGADALTVINPTLVQAKGLGSQILSGGQANQVNSPTLLLTRQLLPMRASWNGLAEIIAGTKEIPQVQPTEEQIVTASQHQIMQSVIICNEAVSPTNPMEYPRYVWLNFITGDVFSAPSAAVSSGASCAGAAPITSVEISGAGLATRPLQLQATGDPQTPYAHWGSMAEKMGSHVVTVHGSGHGTVGLGFPHIDNIVADYLRTGTTEVTEVSF
ncbi:putative hydrolase or acyltransferase of alpha/beta superfamily [Corynebacterium kutscheri]|uniref:Putative hydrolase or acyltransferase of alpha/beta superfamily n=1 Tax=Corynebacterium kutscheri TaxID=35755 RepID=A0A0F6R146_9CORY|nr:alpha/beta hydrolase [Corynebacterium kutscheri]AKE41660.1 putative hydrolase or acyltransferase of alpha/beta superfamily [Corynebacterium kutscheri]VEH09987.1 hydrolase [Corynebacterium kutscheri]